MSASSSLSKGLDSRHVDVSGLDVWTFGHSMQHSSAHQGQLLCAHDFTARQTEIDEHNRKLN